MEAEVAARIYETAIGSVASELLARAVAKARRDGGGRVRRLRVAAWGRSRIGEGGGNGFRSTDFGCFEVTCSHHISTVLSLSNVAYQNLHYLL
jgi:hypothetical protein